MVTGDAAAMAEEAGGAKPSASPRRGPGRPAGYPKSGGRARGTPNKVTREIREAASKYGARVLRELVRLATKSDKEEIRLKASQEILDRAYGRPMQSSEISSPGGLPFTMIQRVIVDEARRDAGAGADDDT